MVEFIHPSHPAPSGDLSSVLAGRTGAATSPFDPRTIALLDNVSRRLFKISRDEPAIAPLAFFLRKANLVALAERAHARIAAGSIAVPQGTAFHVPPTNVDTLFLYTLAISMLAGNSNIVRISPNAGPGTARVLDVLLEGLQTEPLIAEKLTIIRFGRDEDALAACSAAADVRVIWGGDEAIRAIRRSPLPPAAKELTFPDRISMAAVEARAWLDATDAVRDDVAEGLYNDVYWFDQMACSSPAQIVLVGDGETAAAAGFDIAQRLESVASRRYAPVEGQAINKMVSLVAGAGRGLGRFDWVSNDLVMVEADDLASAVEFRPGGGFISTQAVSTLAAIVPQLTRRVQTLSVFGFSRTDLVDLVTVANGRGIDRVVPIGKALAFDAVWDGKDLLLESLRLVTVEA